MRKEQIARSATMLGASDLTIVAPLKKGLVPALDAVTYKTRAMRVLKTLHAGRTISHEYEIGRVLSDAVERVGRIHSIRIALIEPEDKIMLAVTFDGSWESYIRVIWQKVSRCLDLVFCNTEGYVRGWGSSFEDWCRWLREHQAETPFLYSAPHLTYHDGQYLRAHEYCFRTGDSPEEADLATMRFRSPSAEEISDSLRKSGNDPSKIGDDTDIEELFAARPAFRQGMRSLAGLYRLADVYLPGTPDGEVLHVATRELLREFERMVTGDGSNDVKQELEFANRRFRDALDWFRFTPVAERGIPELPVAMPVYPRNQVQGGIVNAYPDVSDGCVVMLAFDSPQAMARFLAAVGPQLTPDAADTTRPETITVNLAVTMEGMRLAGLAEEEIGQLPQEFVHGMERRAGMLGDVRMNHPRRWRLPALNAHLGPDAPDLPAHDPVPRVELSSIHAMLQLRLLGTALDRPAARKKLWTKAEDLTRNARRLSVQWMLRLKEGAAAREHFGYADGGSDPVLDPAAQGNIYRNRVHLGEVLLGYPNAADAAAPDEQRSDIEKLLANGSFLVVRKLRQDVAAFDAAVTAAAGEVPASIAPTPEDAANLVKAKLVGRWPLSAGSKAGAPLAVFTGKDANDFTYQADPQGSTCPFHAHMRRANPRDVEGPVFSPPGARPARLVRRGMSYGELYDPASPDSVRQERGLVFMAYNASIGEQFEVVQRWLAGGNASGGYSGQSDALLGIPQQSRPRVVAFEESGCPVRVLLDGSTIADEETEPLVRLEWGMYLFAPSVAAVQALADRAAASTGLLKAWSAEQGQAQIARLLQFEQDNSHDDAVNAWKEALEDPAWAGDFRSASIWAAIRERHGGVLRTAYGVIAASRDTVDQVIRDREHLSVRGYLPRMRDSFGELYLGLDEGARYDEESQAVNKAIQALAVGTPFNPQVVNAAEDAVLERVAVLVDDARSYAANKLGELRWDLTLDARELTDDLLATFCEKWFGLTQHGGFLQRSGMRWNWREGDKPCYPGHFMAPSRYTFQPHPGLDVVRVGSLHGFTLHDALAGYLASDMPEIHHAIEGAAVAKAIVDNGRKLADADYAVRTLAGVLMGFLPTTDGNMRRVLDEWLNTGTLWALRAKFASISEAKGAPGDVTKKLAELGKDIEREFLKAMQLRAAPETLWRTAVKPFTLGRGPHRVSVQPHDIVVASLISATQECLEAGSRDVSHAFGGLNDGGQGCPMHACPGYGPAMSVMLGFFRALVFCPEALRAGPGPLSLGMEGATGLKGPQEFFVLKGQADFEDYGLFKNTAKRVPFLGIVDSWQYNTGLTPTLTGALKRAGYAPVDDGDYCKAGKTIGSVASGDTPDKLAQFIVGHSQRPAFVLLSGGGNDIVEHPGDEDYENTALFKLLVPKATTAAKALKDAEADKYINDVLGGHLGKVLKAIRSRSQIPVLVHGYDFPIPDGEFAVIIGKKFGPWLQPVFRKAEIGDDVARDVMRILITKLNTMIGDVAGGISGVTHIALTGTLEKQPGFGIPVGYRTWWGNELHATARGFDVLAQKVIAKAPVKPANLG